MRLAPLLLGAVAVLTGCADRPSLAPTGPSADLRAPEARPGLGVMTRNLYVGADVDLVIRALASPDPTDDLPALLHAIQVLQATDFPTRARALAGEIARHRPHVVGLQEVSRLDVDLTALGIPGVVHQDFLAVLMGALAERGLDYRVAAVVDNTVAAPLPGVSLRDYDAILVDARRTELEPGVVARNYSANLGPVAPGVSIIRGWVAVRVRVGGRSYTVASTHLESGAVPGLEQLRAAQAAELAGSLGDARPAVLLGDFNDVPESPMYQVLRAAGFGDVWAQLRPGLPGFTCCQVEDLSNRRSVLDQRIDYVFARGTGLPNGRLVGQVTLVGARSSERIAGPVHRLWPSDHAGIAARLLTPVGLAQRN